MTYLYFKAIHIIFVVSWMAGLFYSVRLFIYHTEANTLPEVERNILQKQYGIMESRLWNIITTPAMVLSVLAGLGMLYINPALLQEGWMHLKLGFVVALLLYHFICQRMIGQFKQGIFNWTSTQLRLWNEVATILLVAIVFAVILRTALDLAYGLIGLVVLGGSIMVAVKLYKKYRTK
ncbi:MAG: protoporphyrinogen oxidase HemJ [Sphingobacteriaceae bacterium]|nr:protoporphyrinogen oxidase HemJ [Sphingobacteriaceae bacterium]